MKVLITGGAGFIGCNAAARALRRGDRVVVVDNLSRRGADRNLAWLEGQLAAGERDRLAHVAADIRDVRALDALVDAQQDAEVVLHLAGQVAVTTSVTNPREDFEINALGSFNVLEAARRLPKLRAFLYTSTNKVYGGMEDVGVVVKDGRYAYGAPELSQGVPETQPLDFHSPYGCCLSADTDILTRRGWKRFYELDPDDDVLTYNLERRVAEFQRPTAHFAFHYDGKMYVQRNRRLQTCVTPNHKMLVAWDCNHRELEKPRLVEAQHIAGKPTAYLLAAEVEGGLDCPTFTLPAVKAGKYKHNFSPRTIPMNDWLRFLGWYLAEGHCYENAKTGNCAVTLTTFYRTSEAMAVMRAIGLSPVVDKHHVTATSRQVYEYLRPLGKSYKKHIPQAIKDLRREYLSILLGALLDGDGNVHSKNGWRYTTVSKRLADDVQEVALKCGLAASVALDGEGLYRVYLCTTRTAQCNLDRDRSEWVDYSGMVYCVEVPNSVVMVRQNGHAYFSGNSKGAADQYTIDYARIYDLPTVCLRQSAIYGERQMGVEDQGWVSWFCIRAAQGKPITVYGDGMQVRDVLWIDDVLDAYEACVERIERVKGQVYNLGGGPKNTLAIGEALTLIERRLDRPLTLSYAEWRPGDQRVFVADVRKAQRDLGWTPKVGPEEGVDRLFKWVQQNLDLFADL